MYNWPPQCLFLAGGELGKLFAAYGKTAEEQCTHCGATKVFAETHLYTQCPAVVAGCAVCEHVLLRLVSVRQRLSFDIDRLTYLCPCLEASLFQS